MSAPLERTVEAEWLDALPADDPRAARSRRDLVVVNRIMGSAGIVRRALETRLSTHAPRIAEIGAGDGTLLLGVAQACGWSRAQIVLVDRQPVVSAATEHRYCALGCSVTVEAADAREWLEGTREPYDAIVANLFLHHFETQALEAMLGAIARRTNLFVACEPRRARFPLAGSRMLGLIGCNDVTRHDAVLSVRAGFAGAELSALWPPRSGWTVQEGPAGLFSHLFVAHHVDGAGGT
ncbi:MAG TPA: methyltransferase domain-containing protein [Burkholderiales bacterium]|nr:methyltransferase domain-containing protein [Burkholderiales bacterium]